MNLNHWSAMYLSIGFGRRALATTAAKAARVVSPPAAAAVRATAPAPSVAKAAVKALVPPSIAALNALAARRDVTSSRTGPLDAALHAAGDAEGVVAALRAGIVGAGIVPTPQLSFLAVSRLVAVGGEGGVSAALAVVRDTSLRLPPSSTAFGALMLAATGDSKALRRIAATARRARVPPTSASYLLPAIRAAVRSRDWCLALEVLTDADSARVGAARLRAAAFPLVVALGAHYEAAHSAGVLPAPALAGPHSASLDAPAPRLAWLCERVLPAAASAPSPAARAAIARAAPHIRRAVSEAMASAAQAEQVSAAVQTAETVQNAAAGAVGASADSSLPPAPVSKSDAKESSSASSPPGSTT